MGDGLIDVIGEAVEARERVSRANREWADALWKAVELVRKQHAEELLLILEDTSVEFGKRQAALIERLRKEAG